jgi:hypothetical protein
MALASRRIVQLSVTGVFAVALACSDGTDASAIASLALTDASPKVGVGAILQLNLTATNSAGDFYLPTGASWNSSAPAIATVDGGGNVSGHTLGSATITATLDGKTATTNVLVTPAVIVIEPGITTLEAGATAQLSATARDAQGNPLAAGSVVWSVDETPGAAGVATVSPTGLLTAIKSGKAKVVATASGRSDHLEIGVPSIYDGVWSGSNATGTAAVLIEFGTAISVQLTKPIVQCGTRSVTINVGRALVNGVFSLSGASAANSMTGRFNLPGQESLSVFAVAIPVTVCDNGQPPFPGTNTAAGGDYSLAR